MSWSEKEYWIFCDESVQDGPLFSNFFGGIITEINSKEHVLLQCVDIVLGAMAFRLNNLHEVKPKGASKRGKRTLANDRLYRHILAEIRTLKSAFNPKMSTAREPYPEGSWTMAYRHGAFVPNAPK